MRKVNLQFGSPQHGGSAPTSALLSWAPLAAGLGVSALLLQPSDTVQAGILGSIDTDGRGRLIPSFCQIVFLSASISCTPI